MRAPLLTRFLALTAIAGSIAGCNGVAGISDLITRDDDASAGDASDAGAGDDASTATDAGSDAGAASDAASVDADVPPTCSGASVGLRITVAATTTQFTGVRDDGNGILVPAGTTYAHCFDAGTQIQLQADPDMSNATHQWGIVTCNGGRRCSFVLALPTAIDVVL